MDLILFIFEYFSLKNYIIKKRRIDTATNRYGDEMIWRRNVTATKRYGDETFATNRSLRDETTRSAEEYPDP